MKVIINKCAYWIAMIGAAMLIYEYFEHWNDVRTPKESLMDCLPGLSIALVGMIIGAITEKK